MADKRKVHTAAFKALAAHKGSPLSTSWPGITASTPRLIHGWMKQLITGAAGFMYLATVVDSFSRYVIAWKLSNAPDGLFCKEIIDEVVKGGRPEVFNTDQGVQFTAVSFVGSTAGVAASMDGRVGAGTVASWDWTRSLSSRPLPSSGSDAGEVMGVAKNRRFVVYCALGK